MFSFKTIVHVTVLSSVYKRNQRLLSVFNAFARASFEIQDSEFSVYE
jgi:hypothetical protein